MLDNEEVSHVMTLEIEHKKAMSMVEAKFTFLKVKETRLVPRSTI